jgi:hypothetical protein
MLGVLNKLSARIGLLSNGKKYGLCKVKGRYLHLSDNWTKPCLKLQAAPVADFGEEIYG